MEKLSKAETALLKNILEERIENVQELLVSLDGTDYDIVKEELELTKQILNKLA